MDAISQTSKITDRTFVFAVAIVRFCRALESSSGIDRTLSRQLVRAATSVGANIEEAQAAQSSADFISKCSIALKEARETLYWLRLLDAAGLADGDAIKCLRQEADQICRILGAIVVRTKSRGAKLP
jgi:four helix bundle protein